MSNTLRTPVGTQPEAEETPVQRSAYRKIAKRIIPLALFAFFVTYIDRANLGITATSMEETLNLTPVSFGLAAGLFYVGYLIMEIPSNIFLERFGARKWIARILLTFGIITIATAFVWNDGSLVTVRILLGLAEAGMYPGLLLYLGYWASKRRRASNWLLFQISLPLSLAFGSLFSSMLLNLDGVMGLEGWRWVFIIEGVITLLTAVLIFFALPDKPKDAKWLTVEERTAVEGALDVSVEKEVHGWKATASVIKSPVAWYLTAMYFCTLVGFLTVNYWAPTIINEQFALGPIESGLLSSIPWFVCTIALVLASIISKRVKQPSWIIVVSMLTCALGMFIASTAGNPVIAFIGLCLATVQQASVPIVFVLVRSHFPITMIAVAFAFVNAVANLAGLAGPPILGWFVELTGSTNAGLLFLSSFFVIAAILAVFAPRFIRFCEARSPHYFKDANPGGAISNG
ncbi:MFS transporter [Glaciibacter superstes]|uniref:MFS transporter n=1 Tax=Glaciibacter superstes TaxID=501023 RepID=UPI0003B7A3F0|nr:MFS transporter [Glaciibacter superstes]